MSVSLINSSINFDDLNVCSTPFNIDLSHKDIEGTPEEDLMRSSNGSLIGMITIKTAYLRTFLDDEELSFFEEDGNNIYCGRFNHEIHLNVIQRQELDSLNHNVNRLRTQISSLESIGNNIYKYSIISLTLITSLSLLAMVVKKIAVSYFLFGVAFTPILGLLLISGINIVKSILASNLELAEAKRENFTMSRQFEWDTSLKRVLQKVLDTALDFQSGVSC